MGLFVETCFLVEMMFGTWISNPAGCQSYVVLFDRLIVWCVSGKGGGVYPIVCCCGLLFCWDLLALSDSRIGKFTNSLKNCRRILLRNIKSVPFFCVEKTHIVLWSPV